MKRYYLLMLLMCLLGSNALAQEHIMTTVTETIDFTGFGTTGGQSFNNNNAVWGDGDQSNYLLAMQGRRYDSATTRISLDNRNNWQIYNSSAFSETYLQNTSTNGRTVNIYNLKKDAIVTIWGDVGNQDHGNFEVTSNAQPQGDPTYGTYQGNPVLDSRVYKVSNDGTITIQLSGQYSGIRKITIQYQVRAEDYFNYDPGYEEYDMYDEFSQNDPQKYGMNNGQVVTYNPPRYSTSYTLSDEETGITLNGNTAKYIVLSGSKITANNRIAIDGGAGDWRFNYGLRAPNNGKWANFSICNLREGDRVVFSYTGTPPVFASEAGGTTAPIGPYNGSNAFFDQYNDGTFDEGEDVYITPGATPLTDWHRGEGNFYLEDHQGQQGNAELYYTRYVVTEDGHLDIAIAPDTRIVKIKIFSDHQATMIDEYDAEKYIAKFDITGELQAKEHIVPGGLEVHVGSDDASQHAHVVRSTHGPVSIVNAVDGFKLPGMSRNEDGELEFEFDLAHKIPETGTFYKFMPLEDGKMTLTFQAASMNYYTYALNGDAVYYGDVSNYGDGNWQEQFDRPNEQTVGGQDGACPYYLVKVDINGNKTFTKINNRNYLNGAEVTYEIPGGVKAGETYYLYGAWNTSDLSYNGSGQGQNNLEYFPYGSGNGGAKKACGVAKLLEVQFNPNKKIYPLAKWVPNGTKAVKTGSGVPNPDTFETEEYLADLWGYNEKTSITVKKMSGNITACNPYLQQVQGNHYRLMIDGIEFDDDNNKDQGGTILIKIGDATQKVSPVYALTIAYSTDPTYDGNSGIGTRGHIWDYSSKSLNGLKYEPVLETPEQPGPNGHAAVYTHNAAEPKDYGHYFADYFGADISDCSSKDEVLAKLQTSGSGLLYDEIDEGNSDWMFNYNLVNAGKLYDPLFSNKYDLEGDNADLIWETEGMVLRTSANSSVMFNEFTGANVHQSEKDPDRYVGILQGGEFRIPWLRKNDRVIIYMGAGKGAFNDQAVFSIRGAYDAVHNAIDPADDYIVGGSHWDGENGDKNYRGCYHFFAQGHNDGPADMVFKMTGGSMCKIYSIQIYRGDRIITNEVVGETSADKFLLWSRAADPNDKDDKAAIGDTYNWTLKYFGKDQKLANGKKADGTTGGVNNDIVNYDGYYAKTGANINDNGFTTSTETDPTQPTYNTFTYTHDYGQIGTFRMRGKDMEKNMKYVADYGEHNVTVAYQQTMKYPYTWDFKDMIGYNADSFLYEDQIGGSFMPTKPDWYKSYPTLWDNSYEKTSTDLSLWETYSEEGTYYLRLNSQTNQSLNNPKEKDNIFQTATQDYDGNQLWANGSVVPETQGLWFYTDDNFNHSDWYISNEGMEFRSKAHKLVIPNVPADAAVYLRMELTQPNKSFTWQWTSDCEVYGGEPQKVGSTNDYIFAIKNNGSKRNLVLSIKGYRLLKLAVSTDPKKVNLRGWTTESRDHVIDPELTAYMTGKDIETCLVTGVDYDNKTVTLQRVYSSGSSTGNYVMSALADGGTGACIIHNKAVTSLTATDGEVKILDGGFHLFVPDMHDYYLDEENKPAGLKTLTDNTTSMLIAQVSNTNGRKSIPASSTKDGVNYTNYALTYKYYKLDENGNKTGSQIEGDEAFYRIATGGASSSGNQGYLPLLTSEVKPKDNGTSAKYGFTFVFEDYQEIPTEVLAPETFETSERVENNVFYNLNGQKLNGLPTKSGLYIMNGKKVIIK